MRWVHHKHDFNLIHGLCLRSHHFFRFTFWQTDNFNNVVFVFEHRTILIILDHSLLAIYSCFLKICLLQRFLVHNYPAITSAHIEPGWLEALNSPYGAEGAGAELSDFSEELPVCINNSYYFFRFFHGLRLREKLVFIIISLIFILSLFWKLVLNQVKITCTISLLVEPQLSGLFKCPLYMLPISTFSSLLFNDAFWDNLSLIMVYVTCFASEAMLWFGMQTCRRLQATSWRNLPATDMGALLLTLLGQRLLRFRFSTLDLTAFVVL